MMKTLFRLVIVLGVGFFLAGCFDSGGSGGGGGNAEIRTAFDGAGGFLWKPKSESTGNLVVLFPNEFRGQHSSAAIHREFPPSAGNKIADGAFHTEDHNGDRVHYRFGEHGSAYGQNIYAVIQLEDGRAIAYLIPNGGSRSD